MIHIALLALALQTASPAQTAPPPQQAQIDCADADHSAFNFWLGDWDVSTSSGVVVATSTISSIADGCGIEENYHQTVGPGGVPTSYRGASYSVFDAAGGGKWRQFYVDSGGSITMFEGGIVEGAMVLIAPGGPGAIQRMIVAPQADGSVRQTGATSRDGGATWSSGGYDFTYRRR
ncbi:MAG: hypothetical protein RL093_98 [Pseudomonadota bacterium]